LKAEEKHQIPVIRKITAQEIHDNYMQVKLDVTIVIEQEMDILQSLKKKNR
jgi:hypothetical protein